MSVEGMFNQVEQAMIYTEATLSYPNQTADKNSSTVNVNRGRASSSEVQLHLAIKNIENIKTIFNEMVEVIDALQGSSGQWVEQWLNDLAKKCSNIAEKVEKEVQ